MIDLTDIQRRIERLEADRAVCGGENPWELTVHDRQWLDALGRGSILFNNADTEVNYADFSQIKFYGPEIDNQEWRAQLNRFFWLRPIVLKYRQNRDENLAKIARQTIEAWLDYRTYSGDDTNASVWAVTGDNTLSTSIRVGAKRMGGWWGSIPYLCGSPYFDDKFIGRIYDSTLEQLEFLHRNISKTSNWRISHLDSLFFIGAVLPGAEKYLKFAVRNINEAFYNQVEADGSHAEHTGGYHMWMTDVFTGYALLAGKRPELGLRVEPERLIKMWDYYIHQYAPDGRDLGIGDDGRWYKEAEPADIAGLKQRRDKIIQNLGLDPAGYALPATGLYPKAGQFYFRKSWDPDSPMAVYDATNFGGWHCHTGRGGVQFYDGRRMLLIDPGSLNYEPGDPFTFAGKQTLFHNTVTIDDMAQLPYADARMDKVCDLPGASVAVSTYMGGYFDAVFTRGLPGDADPGSVAARHTRAFMWIKDKFIFVIDSVLCMKRHYTFRSAWQMDVCDAKPTPNGAYTAYPDGNVLVRAVEVNTPLTCKLYCGGELPPRIPGAPAQRIGYVARDGLRLGGGEPAPMLGIEGESGGKFEVFLSQIIVPFAGLTPPEVSANAYERDETFYFDIAIGNETWHIAGNKRALSGSELVTQIGESGALRTDGRIAAAGEKDGRVFYGLATDASYLTYADETIFDNKTAGDCEIYF